MPLHTIEINSSFLPENEEIDIKGKENFDKDVYNSSDTYALAYSESKDGPWDRVQKPNDRHVFSITAKDVLGERVKDFYGKKVYFRIVSYGLNMDSLEREIVSWSETKSLTVIPSAPKILEAKYIPPKCAEDKEGGKVKITFDRELAPSEVLKLAVTETTNKESEANGEKATLTGGNFKGKTYTLKGIQVKEKKTLQVQSYGWFVHNNKKIQTFTEGKYHYDSFEATPVPPLSLSEISHSDVSCYGGNGTISIKNVKGGTEDSEYRYNCRKKGTSLSDKWVVFSGNSTKIEGLEKGDYIITVRNQYDCRILDTSGNEMLYEVEITAPQSPLTLVKNETTIKSPSVYGGNNGYISVVVSGGTPNKKRGYNYVWKKNGKVVTNEITTNELSNGYQIKLSKLKTGTYTLTITDEKGCTLKQEYVLKDPINITKFSKQDVLCKGDKGGVSIEVNGGKSPYYYTVKVLGNFQQWKKFKQTNKTFVELPKGNYQIKVKDSEGIPAINAKGKNDIREFAIKEPATKLSVVVDSERTTGFGRSDGKLTIKCTGGTRKSGNEYDFEIRKGNKTGEKISKNITKKFKSGTFTIVADKLPSDTYFITITDKNKCKKQIQEFINQPEKLTITHNLIKNISCNHNNPVKKIIDQDGNGYPDNSEDGTLTIDIKGGVKSTGYKIKWFYNGDRFVPEEDTEIYNIRHGKYKVVVTDKYDNKATSVINIKEPERLEIVAVNGGIEDCENQNSGFVSVDVKGGTKVYTYYWNGVKGDKKQTNIRIGTHKVVVEDKNKCKIEDEIHWGIIRK